MATRRTEVDDGVAMMGGEVAARMGRVSLALLVVAAAFLPDAGIAAEPRPCSDRVSYSYTTDEMVATFRVPLARCWPSGQPFVLKAAIERTTVGAPTTTVRRSKRCSGREVCTVKIRVSHPSTEAAEYRLISEYQPTPDGATTTFRPLVCVAADASTRCDHPFNHVP